MKGINKCCWSFGVVAHNFPMNDQTNRIYIVYMYFQNTKWWYSKRKVIRKFWIVSMNNNLYDIIKKINNLYDLIKNMIEPNQIQAAWSIGHGLVNPSSVIYITNYHFYLLIEKNK